MKPEDVGLSKDLQFFKPESIFKENPRVTYTTIYKCDNFSVSLAISYFSHCSPMQLLRIYIINLSVSFFVHAAMYFFPTFKRSNSPS